MVDSGTFSIRFTESRILRTSANGKVRPINLFLRVRSTNFIAVFSKTTARCTEAWDLRLDANTINSGMMKMNTATKKARPTKSNMIDTGRPVMRTMKDGMPIQNDKRIIMQRTASRQQRSRKPDGSLTAC